MSGWDRSCSSTASQNPSGWMWARSTKQRAALSWRTNSRPRSVRPRRDRSREVGVEVTPKHRAGQVHQSDANDRVIGNGSDAIGSSIQCVAALDRDHGSDRALSTSSTILGQRADEGHLAIGLRDDGAHAIEVAKQGAPSVLSGASNVRGDGPHGAGKATFEGAGKVDMTEETSSEGSTSMTREEVIAPQPVRN